MEMDDIRSDYEVEFIEKITNDFIDSMSCKYHSLGITAEKLRNKINEVRVENHTATILEMEFCFCALLVGILQNHIKTMDEFSKFDQAQIELLNEIDSLREKMLDHLKQKPKVIAKKGGQAKAIKTEQCKIEFLRMVDERKPPFDKSKVGLAEAVLELKPLIVKYAKDYQSSVITASTNIPVKWLNEHWNLPKRTYKKSQAKHN